MTPGQTMKRALGWTAFGVGVAAAGYAALAGTAWHRYGHPAEPNEDEADPLLDRFMPYYEVVERHKVRVHAPPAITLAAAADADMQGSWIVRAIFRARELMIGAEPDTARRPRGLLAEVQSLGWRVIAEDPGREIVVGGITQPWLPNTVFRGLAPDEFRGFREPGYVKIVWTLRADPIGEGESIFRTETRVSTTDADARERFRRYWARFSPGIAAIRRLLLGPVKTEAERRAASMSATGHSAPRSSSASAS